MQPLPGAGMKTCISLRVRSTGNTTPVVARYPQTIPGVFLFGMMFLKVLRLLSNGAMVRLMFSNVVNTGN